MKLLCPNCREPLDAGLGCSRGHRFEARDGVLVLLEAGFERKLRAFLRDFMPVRVALGRHVADPSAFEHLPWGPATAGNFHWRLRRADLAVVRSLLRRRERLKVLDVGAWNGWLSHRLAAAGHDVTAIDYFDDRLDGLGARRFYSSSWRAIQMNLADLSILDESFDVVVLNRCLQFAPDPAGFVAAASAKLAPGGLLLLTGLEIFRDPRAKAAEVAEALRLHRERHGFELLLVPTKGYLDAADEAAIERLGVRLKPYPRLLPWHLLARFARQRPRHCYGVAVAPLASAPALDGARRVG